MKIPTPLKTSALITAAGIFLAATAMAQGPAKVTVDFNSADDATPNFVFKTVPRPSADDAATHARFIVLDGAQDANSGDLDKVHDGKLPDNDDAADANFFFKPQTDGGLLLVDLEKIIDIRQINSYSWHTDTRAPQVYKVYGADGAAKNFNILPKKGTPLADSGWTLIGAVNTAPAAGQAGGGQYGVSIANPNGTLGKFRYLLFDISATEQADPFGNTFYSEIDVVDAAAPPVKQEPAPASAKFDVKTSDGKTTITINPDAAPALKDWARQKLAPALAEWYPKIAAMLPSPGYTAPAHYTITLKPMDGVAYTTGVSVFASADFLQKTIGGEAVGSLVHESVHVVQQFKGGNNPGWLVEGTADYIRWFKFEPQSHGADIVWMKKQKNFTPRYDGSYRITANFLNWVTEKYDKEIVAKLNAAMREEKYSDDLWKKYTGKTLDELGAEWKKDIEAQLGAH